MLYITRFRSGKTYLVKSTKRKKDLKEERIVAQLDSE